VGACGVAGEFLISSWCSRSISDFSGLDVIIMKSFYCWW